MTIVVNVKRKRIKKNATKSLAKKNKIDQMEKFQFEALERTAQLITKKEIVYGQRNQFLQTDKEIHISSVNENFMIVHEVGHFLAATTEERSLLNLGLPTNDDPYPSEYTVLKELQAREISRILYGEWAKTLPKDEYNYIKYLTEDIFKSMQQSKHNHVLNKITRHSVSKLLNECNTSLNECEKILGVSVGQRMSQEMEHFSQLLQEMDVETVGHNRKHNLYLNIKDKKYILKRSNEGFGLYVATENGCQGKTIKIAQHKEEILQSVRKLKNKNEKVRKNLHI